MSARYARLAAACQPHGLAVVSTATRETEPRHLALIGPEAARMWPVFAASPEAADGAPDPLDRWSARIIGALAAEMGAEAVFPFGGPPHHPFARWAVEDGRAWPSRLGMLVHETRGLWVSFRGALAFDAPLIGAPAPATGAAPCPPCAAPCVAACPVGAFDGDAYDVARCREHLAANPDGPCVTAGCLARRACPVGAAAIAPIAQRAFTMKGFTNS